MIQTTHTQSVRIAFLAAVGWDSLQAGRTKHLAQAIARAGHLVSFVEFPSLRRPVRRKGSDADGAIDVIRLPPNPTAGRRVPGWTAVWQAHAARRLNKLWTTPTVFVVTTPWWAPLLPKLRADLVCYDCNDHFSVHTGRTAVARVAQWHESLLAASDLLVAVSKPLQDEVSRESHGKGVHLLPNAMDASWFDGAISPVPREKMQCRPDVPIAGFVGALFEWVDLDLIQGCAVALPEIDFVLVGPVRRGISLADLLSMPNIRYAGPVPAGEVPAWIAGFDVGLLPFKRGRISETADPIKLYEYCALGKPAVATHDSGCHTGPTPWITAVNDAEFIAAIPRAIAEDSASARSTRIEFARSNTWDIRARRLLELIELARGEK